MLINQHYFTIMSIIRPECVPAYLEKRQFAFVAILVSHFWHFLPFLKDYWKKTWANRFAIAGDIVRSAMSVFFTTEYDEGLLFSGFYQVALFRLLSRFRVIMPLVLRLLRRFRVQRVLLLCLQYSTNVSSWYLIKPIVCWKSHLWLCLDLKYLRSVSMQCLLLYHTTIQIKDTLTLTRPILSKGTQVWQSNYCNMWHDQEERVGCQGCCFWNIGQNSVQIPLFHIVFSIAKFFITL